MQKSYFNRKSFYSIILSAVVDARGYFMSIDVGYPGRMSDSKVLRYAIPPFFHFARFSSTYPPFFV